MCSGSLLLPTSGMKSKQAAPEYNVGTSRLEGLKVQDQLRLNFGGHENRWWTIRALDERFVILTRQAAFKSKGQSEYTIIDWEQALRGPCNLLGQGGDVDEPGGCQALLRALNYQLEVRARLEAGESKVVLEEDSCEVSYRNNVALEIIEHKAAME